MQDALGTCPICGGELTVAEYTCTGCGASIRGSFRRCDLCNLPQELLHFVRIFLKAQGNIREVERILGLSYPTVKARLAKVNGFLALEDVSQYMERQDRLGILRDFKEGKISLDEALRRM